MRSIDVFLYEWKHLFRSPFKLVAILLFVVAGLYGLHNGKSLFDKQFAEINTLNEKKEKDRKTIISYFDNGKKGPEEKPWIDVSHPFWAIWNVPTYHFKTPSPAIVYSIGQAEQYGFYKNITIFSSLYDSDMAEEITNPERIQSGTLDFSFVVLFLLPLLLIVLLYNIKGSEAEQHILPLIYVQTGSKNWWLISRISFYTILILFVLLCLLLYGALLTDVFSEMAVFGNIFFLLVCYLLLWTLIYFFIVKYGNSIVSNTLKMVGVWLLFAFIVPASIQQWITIKKPTNLMTNMIDAQRDEKYKLYNQSAEVIDQQLFELYPDLKQKKTITDEGVLNLARRRSISALINNLIKQESESVEQENLDKNKLVTSTYWFNPVNYFQSQLNHLAQTHYDDYLAYRNEIQNNIDKRNKTMVLDVWSGVTVDKAKYLEYDKVLNALN